MLERRWTIQCRHPSCFHSHFHYRSWGGPLYSFRCQLQELQVSLP